MMLDLGLCIEDCRFIIDIDQKIFRSYLSYLHRKVDDSIRMMSYHNRDNIHLRLECHLSGSSQT